MLRQMNLFLNFHLKNSEWMNKLGFKYVLQEPLKFYWSAGPNLEYYAVGIATVLALSCFVAGTWDGCYGA